MTGLRIAVATLLLSACAAAQANISAQQAPANAPPQTITFQDALTMARANSPLFAAARTEAGLAREDRVQARAALLPSVNYNTEVLYTQPNGTPSGVFIANNSVHEYLSQGDVHQVLSFEQAWEYRRAAAAEALARAKLDVAARGLVATVAQNYYGLVVGERKYATAQAAAAEAQRFLTISRQLEQGGEVAHSDVIKAQLQSNDRQRDLLESQSALQKARLNLAVLLFRDFNQNFTVVDDLNPPPALPAIAEIRAAAGRANPEVRAALAATKAADVGVTLARAGFLPTLTFDYWYGIDAPHFATHEPDGTRNLGYAAAAQLNLPIWNWGATQSKVRQAELRRKQAQTELSGAQRQLLADLNSFYAEAQSARQQLDLLRQSYELAGESLRLTTLRYRGGEATVLEVVDAQNTLTQAKNAYDDGEVRYKTALANLQTLTGSF
jgi:outer membrane protein TolC